ncbi:MAG TPA: hypothetical protein VE710_01395 [Candidatus Bathyarchaeia archaeon]|nr:hypothetical protein [Candidatus Bathyarchaeia archaeon]
MRDFHVFAYKMQPPREEGKTGTGGVFVTPSEVELAKTGHACRTTSTGESASSNPFVRRPVLASGTGQSKLPRGCGKYAAPPGLPFPHHHDCTNRLAPREAW